MNKKNEINRDEIIVHGRPFIRTKVEGVPALTILRTIQREIAEVEEAFGEQERAKAAKMIEELFVQLNRESELPALRESPAYRNGSSTRQALERILGRKLRKGNRGRSTKSEYFADL